MSVKQSDFNLERARKLVRSKMPKWVSMVWSDEQLDKAILQVAKMKGKIK